MTNAADRPGADLTDRNVLVLGLGVLGGGIGMARYAAAHGARLRITDLRDADQLRPALAELGGIDAEYVLGEHRGEDLDWADLVVRNPGVPPSSRWLALARELGKPVEMELGYFVRHCPARISAVTGTKGKTTTTSLLHQLLEFDGARVHLAGNMGVSAISLLDELSPDDHVLLEISVQQLEALSDEGWPPDLSIITNVDDDHVERYGSMAAYRAVKASLTLGQSADDWCVLPGWDRELAELCAKSPARKVYVHDSGRPYTVDGIDQHTSAIVEVDDRRVVWSEPGSDERTVLCEIGGFGLLGRHNRVNLGFAAAGAYVSGRQPDRITAAVPTLHGVEHRLEPVGEVHGVRYVNDTAATAPIAVASALEALSDERVVLICGGTDKGSDFTPMVEAIERTEPRLVLLPGTGTDRLVELLERRSYAGPLAHTDSMRGAVEQAAAVAAETAASHVVLSPGCASFGLFLNEFDRGRQFVDAVRAL